VEPAGLWANAYWIEAVVGGRSRREAKYESRFAGLDFSKCEDADESAYVNLTDPGRMPDYFHRRRNRSESGRVRVF